MGYFHMKFRLGRISSSLLLLTILLLAACGGGGSSSSGGGSGKPLNEFAGTYQGTFTAKAMSSTVTDSITIKINGNGQITLIDSEGGTATSSLSGNTFSISVREEVEALGVVFCEAISFFNGKVVGNKISGTISGEICFAQLFDTDVSGTFSALKI